MNSMFRYVYSRYGVEGENEHETLNEALDNVLRNLTADPEYGAWPLDLYEDDKLLWSNRDGSPLSDGTCPLNDRAYAYEKEIGLEE